MFRAISADDFPPFGDLRLSLPPVENKPADLAEVHLFTGVNGTGKTRLLCVLAALLGNLEPLQQRLRTHGRNVFIGIWENHLAVDSPSASDQLLVMKQQGDSQRTLGNLMQWATSVPAFASGGTAYVADSPISAMGFVEKPSRAKCLSFRRLKTRSKDLLQAVANLKIQAAMEAQETLALREGTPSDLGTSRASRLVKAVESAVGELTGRRFAFQITSYPKPAITVLWGSDKLPVDLLPDGLRAIIGSLVDALIMLDVWLEGAADPTQTESVFLLDEPETHLHPAWQRKILPAFQRLFPKAQIFVATHSPFVIASLNHGWIHRLRLADDSKVVADAPIAASEGDSYVSVLEEIMGVKEWYDPETEQLLATFRAKRDAAYRGEDQALEAARTLAAQIGRRSMELDYMMGRELRQMDRQLAAAEAKG